MMKPSGAAIEVGASAAGVVTVGVAEGAVGEAVGGSAAGVAGGSVGVAPVLAVGGAVAGPVDVGAEEPPHATTSPATNRSV
jgi:hypothetical protein